MKFIQSLCVTISKDIMLGFVKTGNSEQIVYIFTKVVIFLNYWCLVLRTIVVCI